MISKSKASQIADDAIKAGRRDRAWRSEFTHPLPRWFSGPHLADLSDDERHARFDEMSRRALRRPGWVLTALAAIVAFVLLGLYVVKLPVAVLAVWPASIVLLVRHYTLRREFKQDGRAFDACEPDAAKIEPTTQDRA